MTKVTKPKEAETPVSPPSRHCIATPPKTVTEYPQIIMRLGLVHVPQKEKITSKGTIQTALAIDLNDYIDRKVADPVVPFQGFLY